MAESFNNFFNKSQTFGLNVKVPENTLKQMGKTAGNAAGGVLEPLFTYFETNENVFSGDISKELKMTYSRQFNTVVAMNAADEKVNGPKRKFDNKF